MPDRGKLLENVVAIELFRREEEIFYFQGRKECDFLIKRGNKIGVAIQVCWELDERNRTRKLGGLLEAAMAFDVEEVKVLTYNQEEEVSFRGREVRLMPVWKWLLV